MSLRAVFTAFVCLTLLLPFTAGAQAQSGDKAPQTANSTTTGIPTFYAHGRQVIVEAEVWKHRDKKDTGDTSWIQQSRPTSDIGIFRFELPPAPGLAADDFHVLDNGVEQRINYFRELDLAGVNLPTIVGWDIYPTIRGIWGTVYDNWVPYVQPSATYLIGYVPPDLQPGECHDIHIVIKDHYIQLGRKQYCTLKNSDASSGDTLEETKLEARMQRFANSSAGGAIKVSTRAFAFWSSGVLSLATQTASTKSAPVFPATDFTYVVEVHDSKAPATVQIATEFDSRRQMWNYPCPKNAAIHILGMVYRTNGELETRFGDAYRCDMQDTPASQPIRKFLDSVLVPTLFDTQIELRPGDYELYVVVSDGKKFGRARANLRVEPLDAKGLTMSDIALNSIVRDASWILRDVTRVTPDPLIPSPLVSKNVQFVPVPDARIGKRKPLSVYFEIYEPLLEANKVDVSYSLKITDLKTGSLVMNTGPMSVADWIVMGNSVIPIGLKLAIEKLPNGYYRLEIQVSDSAGRQTGWRQANFTIR